MIPLAVAAQAMARRQANVKAENGRRGEHGAGEVAAEGMIVTAATAVTQAANGSVAASCECGGGRLGSRGFPGVRKTVWRWLRRTGKYGKIHHRQVIAVVDWEKGYAYPDRQGS